MRIAFIGFGEAARAFVATLKGTGEHSFSAYDILLGTPDEAPLKTAAEQLGVTLAPNAHEATTGCDLIVSAVTATESFKAAQSVRDALTQGQVYIDINSVSRDRKIKTAALLDETGARYVDMAVMAPVNPHGHRTRSLVAGPLSENELQMLKALEFNFELVAAEIGAAAAIKMVRSLFVKGLEAVTVQALLAARTAGRLDRVYDSLSTSYPGLDWPGFAQYQLERAATRGVRRAAEMRESASMMQDLGFASGHKLAEAIASLEQEIGELGLKLSREAELAATLDAIGEARKANAVSA